jgi:hypothetical protein
MRSLMVGDRVFARLDPDRKGTVVNLYRYASFVTDMQDFADVKWDNPVLPKQFGDVSSISISYLELA